MLREPCDAFTCSWEKRFIVNSILLCERCLGRKNRFKMSTDVFVFEDVLRLTQEALIVNRH